MFKKITLVSAAIISIISACNRKEEVIGQTEIANWQYGKKAAVSLTYDDGSTNQFAKALPIMNELGFPATFFIITGQIPGSQYQGRFIGRPVKEIIAETATQPTNKENFFERASAVGFLGYQGTIDYHSQAGALVDAGKPEEAYKVIDEVYKKVREGAFKPGYLANKEVAEARGVTWDKIRSYAAQGHEFASHTVTHPRLAALDEPNMLYELEKSKEDILKQLGPKYTFSAEGPYGTENERVVEYAKKIYPALRNRMPEPFLAEINRGSDEQPGSLKKEYVQWQRGATTKTPLPLMKSWVDTVAAHDNNWLVLVIHGVEGIGWEALPTTLLDEYFRYIKAKEDKLWVATFGDVAKYMRERMNGKVQGEQKGNIITVNLTHSLDKNLYDLPLTLKTYVPATWKAVKVKQGTKEQQVQPEKDEKGSFVLYQALPNTQPAELSGV
ncbi:polysaccharide deacetylase family protein [Adhaeribacter radiodurans]|uniref:Polysaccharide deacetylase family protein n=1 Tax=Adhaeribacter radiodurans TaxID=2745197 RepID=A0A7L7L2M8_9BACT|nr:polysaccharide deacetylase family protein [Adhaeribacter radiodurans]QMU27044.1 polysaccharide deacetylase family protein [Adhaeribacter radiodurans]